MIEIFTPLQEITCHIGLHNVTCHPVVVTLSALFHPKLVLDLATLEGCKAEWPGWWLYLETLYSPKMITYLKNNWAVSWLGVEPTSASHESSILTTRPQSHIRVCHRLSTMNMHYKNPQFTLLYFTHYSCYWAMSFLMIFHIVVNPFKSAV